MAKIIVDKRDDRLLELTMKYFRDEDIQKIKQIHGRRWIPGENVWTIPYTQDAVEQLYQSFTSRQIQLSSQLDQEKEWFDRWVKKGGTAKGVKLDGNAAGAYLFNAQQERKLRDQLTLRGYSSKTIKAYVGHVRRYAEERSVMRELLFILIH